MNITFKPIVNRIIRNSALKCQFIHRPLQSCWYSGGRVLLSNSTSKDSHEVEIHILWKDKNGKETKTVAHVGDTLLNAARAGEIDLEGACEGVCACSTCHVILEYPVYEKLP